MCIFTENWLFISHLKQVKSELPPLPHLIILSASVWSLQMIAAQDYNSITVHSLNTALIWCVHLYCLLLHVTTYYQEAILWLRLHWVNGLIAVEQDHTEFSWLIKSHSVLHTHVAIRAFADWTACVALKVTPCCTLELRGVYLPLTSSNSSPGWGSGVSCFIIISIIFASCVPDWTKTHPLGWWIRSEPIKSWNPNFVQSDSPSPPLVTVTSSSSLLPVTVYLQSCVWVCSLAAPLLRLLRLLLQLDQGSVTIGLRALAEEDPLDDTRLRRPDGVLQRHRGGEKKKQRHQAHSRVSERASASNAPSKVENALCRSVWRALPPSSWRSWPSADLLQPLCLQPLPSPEHITAKPWSLLEVSGLALMVSCSLLSASADSEPPVNKPTTVSGKRKEENQIKVRRLELFGKCRLFKVHLEMLP